MRTSFLMTLARVAPGCWHRPMGPLPEGGMRISGRAQAVLGERVGGGFGGDAVEFLGGEGGPGGEVEGLAGQAGEGAGGFGQAQKLARGDALGGGVQGVFQGHDGGEALDGQADGAGGESCSGWAW